MKPGLLLIVSGIAMFLLYSCTTGQYASTNKTYKKQVKEFSKLLKEYPVRDSAGLSYAPDWVGTTNLSMRRPNFVVIHHTAQNSCTQTLKTFTQTKNPVSAHYVICRDGTVHHMLNDLLRAHHAGVSKWGNNIDLNSSSIGIEIDNNGFEPFTDAQINSLLLLLGRLKKAYAIPVANFIGHADIAPGRKVDPSRHFPWQKLAENGFGHWYDTTQVNVPAGFDPLLALRVIGYDIKNEKNAIQSFKIHFVQQDTTKLIHETDRKILYDLMKKYQ
ncbi:MAG: N-acetylmuramoyl-L-alanine amidase [Sphingobacteriales bacterium]|nr:N-acetylmuramoyl-L-alanine amidase [Sphingobacteriales bacterium]